MIEWIVTLFYIGGCFYEYEYTRQIAYIKYKEEQIKNNGKNTK